jgi:hypothetical protein
MRKPVAKTPAAKKSAQKMKPKQEAAQKASAKKNAPAKATTKTAKKSRTKIPEPGRRRSIVRVDKGALAAFNARAAAGLIAPGFSTASNLNLTFRGGKTIPDLSYISFYLDGANWSDSDVQSIDAALAGALADPRLNNVLLQYFTNSPAISSNFLGSQKVNGAVPSPFTRDTVTDTIQNLLNNGSLQNINFANTVVCLFLPHGAILTTDSAATVGQANFEGENEEDSSVEGLGGYHGSCHVGGTQVYFAVGAYSEFVNNTPNGLPRWPDPWKNIVAVFYHELCEVRTDPDIEDADRNRDVSLLGWYSDAGKGEIGDLPLDEAGRHLENVMVEVALANGQTVPIQLMWGNDVGGPEGPFG